MSLEGSDAEARILELEREAVRLHRRVVDMETWRVRALEEGLAMLWTLGAERTATIGGQVLGCASQGFPGATVTVKDHASGVTLGTATADSNGDYSVTVTLSSDPRSIDVIATATGTYAARFGGPTTVNLPAAHTGANVANVTIPPASDWCCGGGTDYYPRYCCSTTFRLIGCNTCPISGADVDWILGGVTVYSGTTNSSGDILNTAAEPGAYTFNWSIPGTSLSGTASGTVTSPCAIGGQTIAHTISTPAGYTCWSSCAIPYPQLYVTDNAGTRAFEDCVTYTNPSTLILWSFKTRLISTGTCVSPTWTVRQFWEHGPGTTCPQGSGFFSGSDDVTSLTGTLCDRPFSLSGTYTGTHGLSATTFLIHE